MQVNLEQNEVTALVDALNWYIPQLREEIGKTENYDMRESLKAEERAAAGREPREFGRAVPEPVERAKPPDQPVQPDTVAADTTGGTP